jgi:hypothetical protein
VALYRSRAPRDVHQPHIAILTVNNNVANDPRTDDALMHAFRDGDALAFDTARLALRALDNSFVIAGESRFIACFMQPR